MSFLSIFIIVEYPASTFLSALSANSGGLNGEFMHRYADVRLKRMTKIFAKMDYRAPRCFAGRLCLAF
jgi:hypothetical protein